MLLHKLLATHSGFYFLAPVQTSDVGEELDLLGREVPMRSIDLPIGLPSIDREPCPCSRFSLPLSKNQGCRAGVTV